MTILKRELSAYFNSATAYIFTIVFVLITSGVFMTQFFLIGRADMYAFFAMLPFFLAVFLPAVTMRLWAEERKGNTLELLLTFPMPAAQLVGGKFLGALFFYLIALASTFPIPVMLHFLGNPDMGAVAGGYIGAALLGAFYIAIGIFISGLVRDQIVAFILSMMACFALHLAGTGFIAQSIDGWTGGLGTFIQLNLGSAQHFESFAKGVIDGGSVLYFVSGTLIFLVLNGFWIEARMRPFARTLFSAAAVLSAGIFIAANWLADDYSFGRFDLTQGKNFTVSEASKNILRNLKAPVTAKLYFSPSDKMPTGMKTLEQDTIAKLEEFRVASQGKLQYKVYHLDPNNLRAEAAETDSLEDLTQEERLHLKGIQPFQIQSIDSDEVGVKLIYAALSLGYKEKSEEIIPQLMPEMLFSLEYDVISRIHRMTMEEKPRIGLFAPYQEQAADPQMQAIMMQLGGGAPSRRVDDYDLLSQALEMEGYEIIRFDFTQEDPLPENIKTLIVLEPMNLNERQLYEINRFVRSGGSLFMAVQNYEYQYDPSGARLRIVATPKLPGVNPLLEKWGLAVDDNILADEQNQVISLAGAGQLGPFALTVPVKTPLQIIVSTDAMNENISISSQLPALFYLWGTALDFDAVFLREQKIAMETLFHSSPYSWTVAYESNEMNAKSLDPEKGVRSGPFPLALYLQGQFPDAFAGREIPVWPGESAPANQNTEGLAARPAKVVLTGASTMFEKQLIQSGGHYTFLLNAVDVLTLGDELVQIRSKKPVNRTISRVSREEKILWRFLVTGLTPLLFALLGILFAFLRARSKQSYLKSLVSKSASSEL